MKAMIFAAGLGTRLKPFTNHHPKALALVNGKTLLERNIRYLQSFGINDIVVNVHHFANQIIQHLLDNNNYNCNILISDETDAVLETGGGLMKAVNLLGKDGSILVMNVDILTNLDLNNLIAYHQQSDRLATLAVTDRSSSRGLLFNEFNELVGWTNQVLQQYKWVNGPVENTVLKAFSGVQVINLNKVDFTGFSGAFSIIDWYLKQASQHTIKAFDHSESQLIDVGKPENILKAEQMFN